MCATAAILLQQRSTMQALAEEKRLRSKKSVISQPLTHETPQLVSSIRLP